MPDTPMRDAYSIDFDLAHRIALGESDPYDEIIQHYKSRILCIRDDKELVAGTFDFYVANVSLAVNSGVDIVDVADSIDQDMTEYCSALFEPGTASDVRDEVLEQFEFPTGSRMLMLHLAKILPEFRGRHLALVAAHKIIEQFGDGLVVAKAQPLQHHDGFNDESAMQYETLERVRSTALKRLTRHWQRLGFEPIGDTGYLGLSTANTYPVPKLREPKKPVKPKSAGPRKRR
jgi:hypothetical protein